MALSATVAASRLSTTVAASSYSSSSSLKRFGCAVASDHGSSSNRLKDGSSSKRMTYLSLGLSSSSNYNTSSTLQLDSDLMHQEVTRFNTRGSQNFAIINAAAATQAVAARQTTASPRSSANRIARTMAILKIQAKVALIPYLTAVDPNLDTTAEAMRLLDTCGCDIIELWVPYSDSTADGPVIRASATRSLAQSTTLNKVLSMLKEVVPDLKAPVVLLTYYKPILNCGVKAFSKAVKAAGVPGLLVPDLPVEETANLHEFTVANDLEMKLESWTESSTSKPSLILQVQKSYVLEAQIFGSKSRPCPGEFLSQFLMELWQTLFKDFS